MSWSPRSTANEALGAARGRCTAWTSRRRRAGVMCDWRPSPTSASTLAAADPSTHSFSVNSTPVNPSRGADERSISTSPAGASASVRRPVASDQPVTAPGPAPTSPAGDSSSPRRPSARPARPAPDPPGAGSTSWARRVGQPGNRLGGLRLGRRHAVQPLDCPLRKRPGVLRCVRVEHSVLVGKLDAGRRRAEQPHVRWRRGARGGPWRPPRCGSRAARVRLPARTPPAAR